MDDTTPNQDENPANDLTAETEIQPKKPKPVIPTEDLSYSRYKSKLKLQQAFERIYEKYSQNYEGISDEIDLSTGQVVVDNGCLRNSKSIPLGSFGLEELDEDKIETFEPEEFVEQNDFKSFYNNFLHEQLYEQEYYEDDEYYEDEYEDEYYVYADYEYDDGYELEYPQTEQMVKYSGYYEQDPYDLAFDGFEEYQEYDRDAGYESYESYQSPMDQHDWTLEDELTFKPEESDDELLK